MDQSEVAEAVASARRAGDLTRLNAIIDRLNGSPQPWARLEIIRAVIARRAIEARAVTPPPDRWLAAYGITQRDGRPLHRYRLSPKAFSRLQDDLKAQANRINTNGFGPQEAAMFVLWAAEWFRRCYQGGLRRWSDVGQSLGLTPDQARLRRLTDDGLRYWRLPELRMNGAHHRLAAIARQGGFPVAALGAAHGGWAPNFLQKLVGSLLGEPSPSFDLAHARAEDLQSLVPELWRHEDVLAVSAELAWAVVELRRQAEADGVTEGVLVSAWLDRTRPDWRDELPIALEEDGARQLIDSLIRLERLKTGKDALRARRFIVLQGAVRREQVELELDGDLVSADPSQRFDVLARDWSRLRLFACHAAAQYISGELGVVEPEDGGRWRCMPSRPEARFDLPAGIPVTVELRGNGKRLAGPFVLPGGEAIGAGLRVCAANNRAPSGAITELEVVGAGSGGYRAEPLYLDAPASWTTEPQGADSTCQELDVEQARERRTWEVMGTAQVSSDRGDRFLVRAGQRGDQRDQILLSGPAAEGCTAEGRALYCGLPEVWLRESLHKRPPRQAEVWWRRRNEREWTAYGQGTPLGVCEFAWRDATTRHIRAKAEAVVLPSGFAVRRRVAGDSLTVEVERWPHDVQASPGERCGANQWRMHLEHVSQSHISFSLQSPGEAEPFELRTPIPLQAWLFKWSGHRLARDQCVSLSDLPRFVARTRDRCELLAELLDPQGRPALQANARWVIEDELPLSVIADDLAALLRSSGRLDAKVRLDFEDSRNNHWYVVEFAHNLEREQRGLVPSPPMLEPLARAVGRSFAEPHVEHDFGPYGEAEQLNHRPIDLDPGPGPWLVYLRANDRVLCRPRVLHGEELLQPPQSDLGRILVETPETRGAGLVTLIDSVLQEPDTERSRNVIRSISELGAALAGLPPSTFEVFTQLESRPLLGPLMLFGASAKEIGPLLRLADNLRMAWCLVPQSCWKQAWDLWGGHLAETFPDNLAAVATMMTAKRNALIQHEPVLAPLLGVSSPSEPAKAIINSFLNRSSDRIRVDVANPFRARFGGHLPAWGFDSGFWRAVDAPIIAAKIAKCEIEDALTDPELNALKDIARTHPRYFNAAFAAEFALSGGAPV